MAKKVVGLIKLQVPAGKANPARHRSALGQRGLNIMNSARRSTPQRRSWNPACRAGRNHCYQDKSFTFVMKTTPATVLIMKAAKMRKAARARIPTRSEKSRARRQRKSPRPKCPISPRRIWMPGCARSPAARAVWR